MTKIITILKRVVVVGLYLIAIALIITAICLIFDFLFFAFSSKMSEESLPDSNTQKILYYLYDIRNLSDQEKLEIIRESEYFPENMKDDLYYANKIFPEKKMENSIEPAYVLNVHRKNGNPRVDIGCWDLQKKASVYWQYRNLIILSPFNEKGMESISLDVYFQELAHASQWTREPFYNFFRHKIDIARCWLATNVLQIKTSAYHLEGTHEHSAHQILAPILKQEYEIYLQKTKARK